MDRPHDNPNERNEVVQQRLDVIRQSNDQVKARVAVDVLRYVVSDQASDDLDEERINKLRDRARNFLLSYFGSPTTPTDDY